MKEASELDARALRAGMFNDGYIVFRGAVAKDRCDAVVQAISDELEIRLDDPDTWLSPVALR